MWAKIITGVIKGDTRSLDIAQVGFDGRPAIMRDRQGHRRPCTC